MITHDIEATGTRRGLDRPSILFVLIAVAFVSLWQWEAVGHLSLRSVGVATGLCLLYLLFGRLAMWVAPFLPWNQGGLPFRFVAGFIFCNTLQFLLFVTTSLAIGSSIALLGFIGLIAFFMTDPPGTKPEAGNVLPGFLALVLSGIAITLLCQELLGPPLLEGDLLHWRLWPDCYVHMSEIGAFARAHGMGSRSSLQMSGVHVPLYHYAIYTSPGAVAALSGIDAFDAFRCFMIPFGLLLTGLAAYALTASIWGAWPGLAGTAGVMLLPDTYYQGFSSKFLSFLFMVEVSPGLLLGIACATLCWIALLEGCRKGNPWSVLLAYVLLVVCLAYRAHIFVANAYLVLIYPCIFFVRLRARWRVLLGIGFTAAFLAAVASVQNSNSIPTLRLDGKSAPEYLTILFRSCEPGWVNSVLLWVWHAHTPSTLWTFLFLGMMVFILVFGWGGPLLLASPAWLRSKPHPAAFWFPFFVVANFLVMSVGLHFDEKKIGNSEDLVHRQFVWAYFVVMTWLAAGLYASCFGNRPPATRAGRIGLGLVAVSLLAVAPFFSWQAEIMPTWPPYANYEVLNVLPLGFWNASHFIGSHSQVDDLFLDSNGDHMVRVSALAERQDFVVNDPVLLRFPPGLEARLAQTAAFYQLQNENDVLQFTRANHIRWFLLHPDAHVAWPASILDHPVYTDEGYRVYSFPP